ncbi:amino acid adenylation domain-containing protein [Amycolatopsis lurida]
MNAYTWFDRSADAFGHCCALEVGGERLTYGELRELVERLATRLIATCGDTPRRVGLLAGRTVAAYAGYLAILRAGATVVPFNPEHPASRIRDVIEAAEIDLVLTDTARADLGALQLVADPSESDGRSSSYPEVSPDDLAYIIFTSGSTGTPKGVPITHGNLDSYVRQVVSRYDIDTGSRVSGNFDLTFDGSVHDLFAAWASGGTLVVPQRGQLLSPVRTVNTLRLTHWFSVPSLISFAARLGSLVPGSMPTLRWSLFGGEAVGLDAVRQWQAAAPGSRLEVVYGPTELTVYCTAYRLPEDPAEWPDTSNGTVPIGTCFPTLDSLLLDENDTPADSGELCVRGPQCFPGYLDPAHDAGRFLAAAFSGDGEGRGRWYRTGDRVTWRDGVLVFLGRTDHQVKIRGHRIELGEVEAVLRKLPGVRDATVLAVPTEEHPELAAVVSGVGCVADDLHSALADRLPHYLLPRWITVLDELPLNANGKVDRRALLGALGR